MSLSIQDVLFLRDSNRMLMMFSQRGTWDGLTIKNEHVASPRIATLPDAIIGAILEYVSFEGLEEQGPNVKSELDRRAHYQSIQLAARLPQRLDSLSSFLRDPIIGVKSIFEVQVKSAALSLLYCCHCLNPSSARKPCKVLMQNIISFAIKAQPEELPAATIAHVLIIYISFYSSSLEESSSYKPLSCTILWKLFTHLFPDPMFYFKKDIPPPHLLVLVHGTSLMAWIWRHSDLCPFAEFNWVEKMTLLWLLHCDLLLLTDVSTFPPNSTRDSQPSTVIISCLLENKGVGLTILIGMLKARKEWEPLFPKPFVLLMKIMLRAYCTLYASRACPSPSTETELMDKIRNVIQLEVECSLERHGVFEVMDSICTLPTQASAQLLADLNLNLYSFLDSTLFEIQREVESMHQKPAYSPQKERASIQLRFLTKWVAAHQFDERVIKPLSFVIHLIKVLVSPVKCNDSMTLEVISLLLAIEAAAKQRWQLNQEQLHTIANALIEISKPDAMITSHVTSEFVTKKSYCFDYDESYPLLLFNALGEHLSYFLWNDLSDCFQHKEGTLSIKEIGMKECQEFLSLKETQLSLTNAMYSLFERFDSETRKYIRASPMHQRLIVNLEREL
ncbi:hypothetical protein O181_007221 [Austropuccinia psidii MF-1]|uniref:Uncharacterized protein n=1 Tax=Austropuccinia psidii MF-1 TaxID=1389203 RepID=A0A9Q3BKF7_9BASI|nr:hypothetical protein [Austropuccinia psidii MF-1]